MCSQPAAVRAEVACLHARHCPIIVYMRACVARLARTSSRGEWLAKNAADVPTQENWQSAEWRVVGFAFCKVSIQLSDRCVCACVCMLAEGELVTGFNGPECWYWTWLRATTDRLRILGWVGLQHSGSLIAPSTYAGLSNTELP